MVKLARLIDHAKTSLFRMMETELCAFHSEQYAQHLRFSRIFHLSGCNETINLAQ